jgi:hypothetical protein
MTEPTHHVKAVDDGVLLVCDCGTETHVVTLRRDDNGNLIPTELEQAFTCAGCGTIHWFTIDGAPDG